jgi:protein involved in polysaccharide export with SLBB domain
LFVLAMSNVGCGMLGSGLFREGHQTTPAAEDLRKLTQEPPPVPRELNKRLGGPYVIEPGDSLLVQAADLDSPVRLPGDQTVLPDGTIHLGKYGRVVVGGKPLDAVEVEIRALIQAKTRDAGDITVRLVNRQSKVFYVLGEVHAPGSFVLHGRETVLDAIVLAGGLTDRASHDRILLSRPTPPQSGRVVLPVCYDDIVQVGDTATNYQIAPGDRIFVPSKCLFEECHLKKEKKKGNCGLCGQPQAPLEGWPNCGEVPAMIGAPIRWTPGPEGPPTLPAPLPAPMSGAWASDSETRSAAAIQRPQP